MEAELGRLFGGVIGIGLVVLLWWATWNSAKKRKIGLSITSYLALFLTPFIAFFVTLFTKKIDKTQEQPTYLQRQKYEHITAMLIAAILYIVFSLLALVVGIMGYANGRSGLAGLGNFAILLTWGISLFFERKELLQAKNEEAVEEIAPIVKCSNKLCGKEISSKFDKCPFCGTPVIKPTERGDGKSIGNYENLKPSFEFESNVQRRIAKETENIDTSYSIRKITVNHCDGDKYRLSILDGESGKVIMQSVPMHNVSYSVFEECLSMESDDNNGEYALNVFYKQGQVYKCVVQRKSKNIYIHYNKE